MSLFVLYFVLLEIVLKYIFFFHRVWTFYLLHKKICEAIIVKPFLGESRVVLLGQDFHLSLSTFIPLPILFYFWDQTWPKWKKEYIWIGIVFLITNFWEAWAVLISNITLYKKQKLLHRYGYAVAVWGI